VVLLGHQELLKVDSDGGVGGTPTSMFYAGGNSPSTSYLTAVELFTTTSPSIVAKDISLD
jgi:hypothetical protein